MLLNADKSTAALLTALLKSGSTIENSDINRTTDKVRKYVRITYWIIGKGKTRKGEERTKT
jgi:hypothetical protein